MKLKSFLKSCALSFLLASSGYASEWHDYWEQAQIKLDNSAYQEAVEFFDLAVEKMEAEGDIHSYVYIDRAQANLALNQPEKSIVDTTRALSDENLSYQDKVNSYTVRCMASAKLNNPAQCLEDLKAFGNMKLDRPSIEINNKKMIIRNLSSCPCFQKGMVDYVINVGLCEKKEDIKVIKGGIFIIDLQENCDCGCEEKKECAIDKDDGKIGECKTWCDRMAVAGAGVCAHSFKGFICQTICMGVVYELQQKCYGCCESGKFYKTCVKPFEDIIGKMGGGCDPQFD